MITMVILASAALMLTFGMMRSTARAARRDRSGIRWQGIDWSAREETATESETKPEVSPQASRHPEGREN